MVSSFLLLLSLLTVPSAAFTAQPISSSCVLQKSSTTTNRQQKALFAAENNNPFSSFQGLFSGTAVAEPKTPAIPDFVVDSDYTLAAAFAGVGLSTFLLGNVVSSAFGGLLILLATLFAVQATRIRFVFDENSFELKNVGEDSEQLTESGENFVVGGANRWRYDTFVNWEFFPKGSPIPILVYFKETQTVKEDGSNDGQIHFFPVIANVKQLKEQFELRGCAKVED